jgi:diadenosine tetraphosphatase ApaH/serine/threonine PP2A family protein phosphatase
VTLALLYDVHGNLPALEAVLEDAQGAGATRFVLGGDYALFGPWPRETVERLRQLDAEWIRGNGERWTARPGEAPDDPVPQSAITAAREALGELTDELAALPEQLVHDGVRYCHGSPVSDVRSFFPEPAPDEAELLAGVSEPRLVFGHTHVQFRRAADGGVELVNPGSVGMPFDGDRRAAYALVDANAELELRRVAYDADASAAALRDRFNGPFVETVARRIETARMQPD